MGKCKDKGRIKRGRRGRFCFLHKDTKIVRGERQTDRQRQTETDRDRQRQRDRERQRQTDRQTNRGRGV